VTPFVVGARPYTPGAGFSSDSYLVQHGSWVRPTEDPAAAADAYFQSLGAAAGAPAQVDESAFRKEALALNAREIDGMVSTLTALTSETSKLKLHSASLAGLAGRREQQRRWRDQLHCPSDVAALRRGRARQRSAR